MKRALLLGVAGLAACVSPWGPGDGVYRARAVATLNALHCSRQEALALGYQVMGWAGGARDGTLRAERRFDADGVRPSRGYITVSVAGDSASMMYVTAERVAEAGPRVAVAPGGGPRPTPPPMPVPTSRRLGPERVSPGRVATDARRVLLRCAMGVISEQPA